MSEPKLPPSFKTLLPFTRRADELDRDTTREETKLIAYYCRQYAMELGIKLRQNDSSNEATNYLLALMDRLEEDKGRLGDVSLEDGKATCERFALEVFSKADDEDRAGRADKHTARTFYAASIFLEIMNQFGDVDPDIAEKLKYSKYKAATILKALKEGQMPTPGGPGDLNASGLSTKSDNSTSGRGFGDAGQTTMGDQSTPSTYASASTAVAPPTVINPNDSYGTYPVRPQADLPPPLSPSELAPAEKQSPIPDNSSSFPSMTTSVGILGQDIPSAPLMQPTEMSTKSSEPMLPPPTVSMPPSPPISMQPQPTVHSQYAMPVAPPPSRHAGAVSQNEINDAMECAKFAIAALKIKDLDLARQRLEMALGFIR